MKRSCSKGSPPLPSSVAEEAWSCLDSCLVASFLDEPSDFCSLSTCGRAFVPFRTQIRRVKNIQSNGLSLITDAICGGRLPCLSTLWLDLYNVVWELGVPPILEYIIAGIIPSLKYLRMKFHFKDRDIVHPMMVRLVAGSAAFHLERLQLICGARYIPAIESIRKAALKYPHLSVDLIWR